MRIEIRKVICHSLILICFAFFCLGANAQRNTSKKPQSTPPVPPPNNLSQIESEVIAEINLLRTDPASYLKILQEMRASLKGKTVKLPNGTLWTMNEGAPALDSAIKTLEKQEKLKALELSDGLSQASRVQLKDLQEDITLGHMGRDGSDVNARLSKIGLAGKNTSENLAIYSTNAREIVLSLVIDDGLITRIHRANLLSDKFEKVGAAYGTGKKNVGICVIVMADKFEFRKK